MLTSFPIPAWIERRESLGGEMAASSRQRADVAIAPGWAKVSHFEDALAVPTKMSDERFGI
jgi:hypothetical protein